MVEQHKSISNDLIVIRKNLNSKTYFFSKRSKQKWVSFLNSKMQDLSSVTRAICFSEIWVVVLCCAKFNDPCFSEKAERKNKKNTKLKKSVLFIGSVVEAWHLLCGSYVWFYCINFNLGISVWYLNCDIIVSLRNKYSAKIETQDNLVTSTYPGTL